MLAQQRGIDARHRRHILGPLHAPLELQASHAHLCHLAGIRREIRVLERQWIRMHGDPHVPNDGRAHHGYKLREGLVIAIEPWFLKTTDEIFQDPKDGWTLRASDGSRGAHSEHTIAITENGPIVFTDRTNL